MIEIAKTTKITFINVIKFISNLELNLMRIRIITNKNGAYMVDNCQLPTRTKNGADVLLPIHMQSG